ncbi:MAG: TonB-dependent receptor plug domain-containing protein [Dysgonamonadaceae bacterium]|nr:TonB-dependent receptor plug domain-containing protein [Dysgonamonadaceae bacterium]
MKKHYFLLLFLLIVPDNIFCQAFPDISIDSLRNNLIRQLQLFPQEKIYVHTDKQTYRGGETIWFKVYLTDAVVHYPSELSRFVYVELISPKKVVVRREKIRIAPDESCGQIELSATLPEGSYILRAYSGTFYGMEEDYFFHKNISVRSSVPDNTKKADVPREDYALSFFPEGGNLLEGIACKIAFKAIKSNGLAENIRGSIRDNEGNVALPSFQSLYKGMGHFVLKPEAGKTYYAVVENDNRTVKKFPLPVAFKSAAAVSVQGTGDTIRISVNRSPGVPGNDSLFLIIHSRGIAEYAAPWNFSVPYLNLKKSDFPSGILQVLLLDKNYHPLSERSLFCLNDDQADLSVETNQEHFSAREQVLVDLKLRDKKNQPLTGNFSVSVTDNAKTLIDTTSNIFTYLLLTSDLKGYIENPAFYFEQDNPLSVEALDNLMLTQGWRRYNIPEIAKGNGEASRGFIESGQEISGSVKGLIRKKGIANSKVRILSLENRYADETTADAEGNFSFVGLDFPNKTNFIVQAFSRKGDDRVDLHIHEDEFPPVENVFFPALPVLSPDLSETAAEEEFIQGKRLIHLKEVEIKAKPRESPVNFYSRMADTSFDSKKIEELNATCVHELLRRIPGVIIQDDKAIIRGAKSIYGKPYAAIAIDGVIIESFAEENDYDKFADFDLDQINMMDIERVDVYKTGNTVIWGSRGGKGVVAFTTKKGSFNPSQMERTKFNSKKISPLGYIVPAEFYSPEYETEEQKTNGLPDRRTTLFWKPNVSVNENGDASFDFYTSDNASDYLITIEGITNSGEIIHKTQRVVSYH